MSHADDATKLITDWVNHVRSDMAVSHVGEHVAMQGICLQMIAIQLAGIRDALEALAPNKEQP